MVESAGAARGHRRAVRSPLGARDLGAPDLLLPAGLAVVAAVVALLRGFDATLSRDLGLYAYAGVAFADGDPPYVGVFNRAGPLAHVLPAVGVAAARVVGADELLGIRVFFLLLSVASVPVAYWLVRDVFGSRAAGVVAAVTLAAFPAVTALATGGPREKTPMVLLMLLALWALAHRRWFLAGVLVALATLVLQIALSPLLPPAALAAWWLAERGRFRALATVAAGGATAAGVAVGCFVLVGQLPALVDGFLVANARYTTGRGFLARPAHVWSRLGDGYGAFVWLLLGGLVVLVVLAVVLMAAPSRRADTRSRFVSACAVGSVVGLVWCGRDFDSWPDTYLLLPFTVLGLGGGAWALLALLARVDRRVAVVATVAWTVLALVLGATYSVAGREDGLELQRRSVAAALSVLPGAAITSIEAPEALVLAGQRNPTRHQMFSEGTKKYIADTWPGGFRGFTRWLETRPQQLVAVSRRRADRWGRILAPRYHWVGGAPGMVWLVDSGVDRAVREELRVALRAVCRNSLCPDHG